MNSPSKDISILYSDDSFLVIDKPPGLVVNRSENDRRNTLQDWIEESGMIPSLRTGSALDNFRLRSGIVHRLDKDTSGIILVAKNETAFRTLQGQFLERKVEKIYLTLVHGKMVPMEGDIKFPIGRLPWNRKRFGVIAEGRAASTSYSVIHHYSAGNDLFSYLEVKPHTGRTHQIRVHLSHLGFSIVSDSLYLDRNTYQSDELFCPRIFLHASAIRIYHPVLGKEMQFSSPLPHDLARVLDKLTRTL